MLCKKVALISLISISAGVIFPGAPSFARTLNQEINTRTMTPEAVLYASKGYSGGQHSKHPKPHKPHKPHKPQPQPHKPQPHKPHQQTPQVHQNVNKTTVVTPVKANSTAKSSSNSHSTSNANAKVNNSGNSRNSNSNVSKGGNATIGDVNNNSTSTSSVGDQKNRQSLTTGSTSVSPSTKVKVDGDKYNSVHFGDQAPGTGSEAFSFQYRSACGANVNYRQGFALKPKRIAGGGLGFALDISSTSMDTIESREGVQDKMDAAFLTAMKVVDNQEIFQQRLNSGAVSYREAQAYAIANCAPHYPIVQKTHTLPKVRIRRVYIQKPRSRVCTARGCN